MAKSQMSVVKFRVRENALMLREFTVDEMIRATGLKKESIRTELQRMKREKFLTTGPFHAKDAPRRRGGQKCVYKLTADPEKRLALSRQVRLFYPTPPAPTRPTSRHFFFAQQLLKRLKARDYKDEHEQAALLEECKEELDFAWYEEGEPTGVIDAFIKHQRACLAYLSGEYREAGALFTQVKNTFAAAGLSAEAANAEAASLCASLQIAMGEAGDSSPENRARITLDTLQRDELASLTGQPLLELLVELLKDMTVRAQVLAEARKSIEKPSDAVSYEVIKVRMRERPADVFGMERYRQARRGIVHHGRVTVDAIFMDDITEEPSREDAWKESNEFMDLLQPMQPRVPFAMYHELGHEKWRKNR